MKRMIALTLALMLALALTGCGGSKVEGMMHDSSSSTPAASTPAESKPAEDTPAASTPAESAPADDPLAASGNDWIGRRDDSEDGFYTGRIGDTFRTYFFDYSIDSAEVVDSYGSITAAEGNKLVDVVVTINNSFSGQVMPMFIYDFQIAWGNGDDECCYQAEGLTEEGLMPDEYEIKRGERVTHHILYEVPADATDLSIAFLEEFSDDTQGDIFVTYFEL